MGWKKRGLWQQKGNLFAFPGSSLPFLPFWKEEARPDALMALPGEP